jgi:tRNA A37 threonylcarbamoyladenosine dehydratase
MLARSGVGRLRLIDFDNVTLSSLNRAALATLEDVGTSKVEAMRRRLAAIVPSCEVEAVQELFRGSRAAELLAGADYVVDCIDNVDSKVELLAYCHGAGVRVLSSMGAALKADPSKLRVCDLSETLVDPLSRVVRQKLARLGVDRGITVVYSVERPRGELLPLSKEQEENPDEFRALEDVRMRVRVLPVLGTEPALFGNALAAVVLLALAGHDLQMDPPLTGRTKVYERIHAKAVASGVPLPRFDSRTMERLVEHTWRGKCARTGTMLSLTLVPWDPARDPDWDNLVVLNTQEAKRHQRIGLQGADPEWVKAGERALAEFRAWMRQRREDSEEASRTE